MKKTIIAVTVIFGLCAAGADVHAQAEAGYAQGAEGGRGGKASQQSAAGLVKACSKDISRFCDGVGQGPGLGKCLQENESGLAPGCLEALKKMPSDKKSGGRKSGGAQEKEVETALNKSCGKDITQFCKGLGAGPEQGRCLKQHEAELSAECGKTLKTLRPPEQGVGQDGAGQGGRGGAGPAGAPEDPAAKLKKACGADIERFCKTIAEGPKQGQCLLEHEARLSAGCGETLKSLPRPEQEGGTDQGGQGGRGDKAGQSRSGKGDPGVAIMKSCKTDAEKLCKGIAAGPDQGRCLKQHEAELSAECGKTLKNLPPPGQTKGKGKSGGNQSAIATLMKACKGDADKFCKDIAEGPELGHCLMERETELSAGCGKTLKSLPPPDQAVGMEQDGQGDRGEGGRGQDGRGQRGPGGGQGQRGPGGGQGQRGSGGDDGPEGE